MSEDIQLRIDKAIALFEEVRGLCSGESWIDSIKKIQALRPDLHLGQVLAAVQGNRTSFILRTLDPLGQLGLGGG